MNQGFGLQVKFWGVRGSIPTPEPENMGLGGDTTCIEILLSGRHALIIDAGTGLRSLGRALAAESPGSQLSLHCLMTHFHWDHIQGIPFFAPLYNASNDVTFYADRPAGATREFLEGQMSSPYYPITFEHLTARRQFVETQPEFRIGDVTIRPFSMNHPQGATGYRLEAEGSVIVHASDLEHGDSTFERTLLDHAQNADILIYDAQYTPEEYVTKRGWGHSTWMEAVRVAREAHVKTLVLFHHDPAHDDGFMAKVVEDARVHFENVEAAKQGRVLNV